MAFGRGYLLELYLEDGGFIFIRQALSLLAGQPLILIRAPTGRRASKGPRHNPSAQPPEVVADAHPVPGQGEVWAGSISRDIGVHFTGIPGHFVTHKIDEDIDEVRYSFGEDMLLSSDKPRLNLGGDPYFTDGLLLVLLFERRPILITELQFFDWEKPVGRHM